MTLVVFYNGVNDEPEDRESDVLTKACSFCEFQYSFLLLGFSLTVNRGQLFCLFQRPDLVRYLKSQCKRTDKCFIESVYFFTKFFQVFHLVSDCRISLKGPSLFGRKRPIADLRAEWP